MKTIAKMVNGNYLVEVETDEMAQIAAACAVLGRISEHEQKPVEAPMQQVAPRRGRKPQRALVVAAPQKRRGRPPKVVDGLTTKLRDALAGMRKAEPELSSSEVCNAVRNLWTDEWPDLTYVQIAAAMGWG